MKNRRFRINKYYVYLILVIVLVLGAIRLLSPARERKEIATLDDLNGARICVQTGTAYEELLKDRYPDMKQVFFSTSSDGVIALQQGKIDGLLTEYLSVAPMKRMHPWLEVFPEPLETLEFAFAVGNNDRKATLLMQMNDFVRQAEETGLSEELWDYWIENYDPGNRIRNEYRFPADGQSVRIAVESGYEPFSFIGDGTLQGHDVEFAMAFCEAYGYRPEFIELSFDSIIPGIETGKYDLGANLIVTEERGATVSLTEPYLHSNLVVLVGEPDETAATGFAERFRRTFVEEGRWKLFAQGAVRTFLITVLALAAGTLLGFAAYVLCRDAEQELRDFMDSFGRIVHGTPTVLLLMIFYYIIFGHSTISGFWVSVIGFTLLFLFTVYGLMESGSSAVGPGQTEVARALGYGKKQAFFRIVLPQSAMHFLPLYRSEVISLIKETSVVGYIAVQDLTKISDIIRARTFDALFPLVSTALIYFLIIYILTSVVGAIEFRTDPVNRRERMLEKEELFREDGRK